MLSFDGQVEAERARSAQCPPALKAPLLAAGIFTPRGCRAGAVIGHLLLARQAGLGDNTSHDLAQTPPMLRGQRGPERWRRHLLRARGLGGTERHRRGGAWSGVHIRPLLTGRRADVDTTGPAVTALIHEWLPYAAARDKRALEP